MSMLTDRPAAATVKAVSELEVLVMSEAEFAQAGADFPIIHRNIGRLLTERLSRSIRFSPKKDTQRITVLLDHGAPPLLGYALACSLAWHTRRSTLLLVMSDAHPAELRSLLARMSGSQPPQHKLKSEGFLAWGAPDTPSSQANGAHLMLAEPTDIFSPRMLRGTLDDLGGSYEDILVQLEAAEEPGQALAQAITASSDSSSYVSQGVPSGSLRSSVPALRLMGANTGD
jgi:hypothetical protein